MKQILLFALFILMANTPIIAINTVDSLPLNTPKNKEHTIRELTNYPIILKNDTLFFIKHAFEDRKAKRRAERISEKIVRHAPKYNENLDSVYLIRDGDHYMLMFNNEALMAITRDDAKGSNESFKDFCLLRQEQVKAALKSYRYDLSKEEWTKRILFTLISFIGIILFLKIINLFFNRLDKRLSKYERRFLARKRNLLRYFIPRETKNIFVFASRIGRVIIIITFLVIFVPMMFSFLPWTQGIVEVFYSYLLHPIMFLVNGLLDFIPHLIFIVVILTITRYIVQVLKHFAEDINSGKLVFKGFPQDWAAPTMKLISVIIYAFAIVMIFPHLPGSDSPAFKGVSIFIGVLFSLGSTSAIANLIAGIVITYMRPYQVGDRVNIIGTEGDVVERTMLVTRIKTVKNIEVTIPNATIINNHLINYSSNAQKESIVVSIEVSIGYDVSWDKVNQLLMRSARQTKMILRDPKPFVLQTGLDDNYVVYSLSVHTKQVTKMLLIRSELYKSILEVFNKEGIEILSPKYVASRDGNFSTVPSQNHKDLRNPVEKVIDAVIEKKTPATTKEKKDKKDNDS